MKLNDSEWTVMQALWARGSATARDVHADVETATEWSYSTVRTLLSRLAGKGAVSEARSGKQLVYTPELARDDARQSALRSLVDNAFGGRLGTLVQHLAAGERLSARDRAELQAMLDESDARRSTRRKGGRR